MRPFLCALVLLGIACRGPIGRAERLIDEGELFAADQLLVEEIREHPTNLEAHFLLGKARLMRNRPDDAATAFAIVTPSPDYAKRVAEVYWKTAEKEDAALASHCLRRAVDLDRELADAACVRALTVGRHLLARDEDVRVVLGTAGGLGPRCRRKTVAFLESALRDSELAADPATAHRLAKTATRIDPDASVVVAEAMRDRAFALVGEDHDVALAMLKNALVVDRSIAADARTASLQTRFASWLPASSPHVSPRTTALDATIERLYAIGNAILEYAYFHRELPPAGDFRGLERHLVPEYLPSLPKLDGWGTEFRYVANDWQARLISAGPDRAFTRQSSDLSTDPRGVLDPGGADLIWEDGALAQRPASEVPSLAVRAR